MPVYLKSEAHMGNENISLRGDCMGISLLALMMAPWAAIGLVLEHFSFISLPDSLMMLAISTLVLAVPKLIQLLSREPETTYTVIKQD